MRGPSKVLDSMIDVPFDLARPRQIAFSNWLGEKALKWQANGDIGAESLARVCEIVAPCAERAVERVHNKNLVKDPNAIRPKALQVVPEILSMNAVMMAATTQSAV